MYEMLRLLLTYLSTVLILTSLSMFRPQKVQVQAIPLTAPITAQPLLYSASLAFDQPPAEPVPKAPISKTLGQGLVRNNGPKWSESELDCVSQMVWGESRNQPYAGMVATAASAINRAKSGLYSRSLCAIVRSPGQYKGYWKAPKPVRNAAWAPIYRAVVAASYHRDKLPVAYRQILYFSTGESDFHNKKETVMTIGDHVYVK